MADRETYVSNSSESALSSPLAAGATSIPVVDTSTFPAIPFYLTIDPDVDAKREIILVDGSMTSTTLELSSATSRGADGTSDVAHDSGATVAIVPVAGLWTDINDRIDAIATTHDHDTDYSATGHDHDADYATAGHTHAEGPHSHDDLYYTEAETDTLLSGKQDTGAYVTSPDYTSIVEVTQAEYDALTPSAGVLYIIVD